MLKDLEGGFAQGVPYATNGDQVVAFYEDALAEDPHESFGYGFVDLDDFEIPGDSIGYSVYEQEGELAITPFIEADEAVGVVLAKKSVVQRYYGVPEIDERIEGLVKTSLSNLVMAYGRWRSNEVYEIRLYASIDDYRNGDCEDSFAGIFAGRFDEIVKSNWDLEIVGKA